MASRRIEDLVPQLQELYLKFKAEMDAAGIPFILTCTYRSQAEQDSLYAQGRTEPGKIVTWTRHSKHNEGRAFDIAIVKDGKVIWDLKVDVNDNEIPDYLEAAKIGESVGLRAGGLWKAPKTDYPHYEI